MLMIHPVLALSCDTDPRIFQGPAAWKPGMTITAQHYLHLSPTARKALGEVTVCPNVPVLDGIPMEKITIDFSEIYYALQTALKRQDSTTIKDMVANFRAAPMPVKQFAEKYPTTFPATSKQQAAFAKIAAVQNSLLHYAKMDETNLLVATVYAAFGGSFTDPDTPVFVCPEHFYYAVYMPISGNDKETDIITVYDTIPGIVFITEPPSIPAYRHFRELIESYQALGTRLIDNRPTKIMEKANVTLFK